VSGPAPWVLVVAGRDSSGRAGVDADREALEALGLPARFVETARTRQGAAGLEALGSVEPARWLAEARAALAGAPAALKLGLLPGARAIDAAAELLRAAHASIAVLDPVLAPTRGGRFLQEEEVPLLRARLAPLGAIWTPNLPELAELTGAPLARLAAEPVERVEAARELLAGGARAVVVKGGHGAEEPLVDLLLEGETEPLWIERERVAGPGLGGSGCRFASALAGRLALGEPLPEAARHAGEWVAGLLRARS